ncbi:MAG: hypothetical protein U0103_22640 [Candidatus Obscuribacterales bacterium]
MNSPADNTVPSYLVGDPTETLLNIKSRGDDSETGTWLASLVNDALEIAAHGDAEQPVTDADLEVMVKWVAEIFNEFELYKIEFNKKAAGSDLIVDASPLNLDSLSATNDHFEAHLSTRYWSLAFDASTRKLDVYLIPAELLLAFTTNRIDESEYRPFLTFTPRRHRDQYHWSFEERTITFAMLPKLAKELFGDLIKVASGHISEDELVSNASNGVAEAALIEAEVATTDRSYDVDRHDSIVPGPDGASVPNVRAGAQVRTEGNEGNGGNAGNAGNGCFEEQEPASASIRTKALKDSFFARCAEFSHGLESEMQAVIAYAKMQPNDVAMLQNCKQIITEIEKLRTTVVDVSGRLRRLP